MNNFNLYLGRYIRVELPGKVHHTGLLIDFGTDIIVLYNGKDFYYIPLTHIHLLYPIDDEEIEYPSNKPFENEKDPLSVRKILTNSKGIFSEIMITNKAIHGYVTNVLNDYFVFYSPIYQTIYVSFQHLKWLIPYKPDQVPYSLDRTTFTSYPSTLSLARSLDEQLKKLIGKVVILDLGENSRKVGQLKGYKGSMVELITAREEVSFVNFKHVKSVQYPSK